MRRTAMTRYIVEIVQKEHYNIEVCADDAYKAVAEAFCAVPWWTQLCDKRDFEVAVKEVKRDE